MLERDIVAAIKTYLTSLGRDVFFWKEHGGPYGTSGVPDIIVCYKGRFIGMECKLPSGHLTELQKRAIRKINEAGGYAARVESVSDAQAIIRRVDEEITEGHEKRWRNPPYENHQARRARSAL